MTKLHVFKALWGMDGELIDQVRRIAEAGYAGIEAPLNHLDPNETKALLAEHGLSAIAMVFTETPADFERELARAAEFGPVSVTAHSGRDCWSHEEGSAFFEAALEAERRVGVPVGHETHRGRVTYTPWDTAFYLQKFPDLKIVADFSHWVNVCERLPDDQADALALAHSRTLHLHARVGYEQGPQVPDPSAPEYGYALAWHERQWDAIRQAAQARGQAVFTATPEYGPPGYLHTLPHTNVPVADLWAVCRWGAERLRGGWGAA